LKDEGDPTVTTPPKNIRFKELFSIPSTAQFGGMLCLCRIGPEEGLSNETLRILKAGVGYYCDIPLDLGPEPSEEQPAIVRLLHVLQRTSTEAIALGLLTIDKRTVLSKDENLIAMVDILGFSDIMSKELARSSMDEFETRLVNTLIAPALAIGTTLSFDSFIIDENDEVVVSEQMLPLEVALISDTILLYWRQTTRRSASLKVLCETLAYLFDIARAMGWLMRGAVEVGSFRAIRDKNVYFGTALLKAHRLELAQDWAGCVLGAEVVQRFPEEIAHMKQKGLIVEYPCPIKDQFRGKLSFEPRFALNWAYSQNALGDREKFLRNTLAKAPLEAKMKLKNTQSFLKFLAAHDLESKASLTKRGFRIHTDGSVRAL